MSANDQEAALAQLALTDLWGIADRLARRLQELGIDSPLNLRRADSRMVRQNIGVVGERMVLELQGIPYFSLEEAPPDRKSIMASRSFGRPVASRFELEEALSTYVARAAEKMRRQHLAFSQLVVFIHTNRFKPQETQHVAQQAVQLPVATADTGRLIAAAIRGLEQIWRPGLRYKKAGAILLDLTPADAVEAALFDPRDSDRSVALMTALDAINGRFGRGTLTFATSGRKQAWKLRRQSLSGRYTTSWDELLRV